MRKLILSVLMLALLPAITGLGVGPAHTELILSPGEQESVELLIANPSTEKVRVEAKDELSKYVTMEQEEISFNGSKKKKVKATIRVPQSAEPGPKDVRIMVKEVKGSEDQITVGVSVAAKVTILVPYPGKYVRANIVQKEYRPKAKDSIITEVTNLGNEDIESLKVKLEVDGKSKQSGLYSLNSKGSKYVSVNWTPRKGKFNVEGNVVYDGAQSEFSGTATVGSRTIDINAEPEGPDRTTLPLSIHLYNNWSESTQVSTSAEIVKNGNTITSSPAPIVTLDPRLDGTVQAILDTEGLEGKYEVIVKAEYNGKSSQESYDVKITDKEVVFDDKTYNTSRIGKTHIIILTALIVALLLAITLWKNRQER